MNVLSTAKLPEYLKDELVHTYPSLEFSFKKSMEEALPHLDHAEILLTYGEDLNEDLIDQAKALKWIMVLSAGMDEMPFQRIKERNILVTNSRGIHQIPMAEYAISMLLQVSRQAKTLLENQNNHVWDRRVPMTEISGSTMTIVGSGAIGQELARLAKAFRMKTIGVSRSGQAKEYFDVVYPSSQIEKALPEADFVVSILPSTEETHSFYKKEHFQVMKDSAVFLNMGRGDVVKSEVLLEALNNEEMAHAILDVTDPEPLPKEHSLWDHKNVTITPHLSGQSVHYLPRAIDIFKTNLDVYLHGKDTYENKIDLDKGY
ncbi:D-2-hydroxyacid dehydrogenase [Radiobacillus kanasensis]|uniref:D-2-hydroxyacid dehydrogenase n=1 Tax=Radiobacillus kanasensis TaxID=2844358 RepID=UPI001E5028E4|nr:D-2-hydroxyacid dehydrogenase [Radiobacillus kanasensis]UFU00158.1 D-2-hydroxyacid dehydrogenase [Radiobacillus kanasensis]